MKRAAIIAAALPATLAGVLPLPACSDRQQPQPASVTEPKVVRDDAYPGVLGVIASVPAEGNPASELRIHHEHIPTFRTKEGEINISADGVPGMKSMVMPFPIAEGLDVSTLRVGDKVRFDFVVRWGSTPPWQITAFEVLDPETAIDFANKAVADDHAGHDHPAGEDHSGHDHP